VADFVRQGSIVRRIWGDGDMVLLVFAGAAAEFALNRAVDWLFFTGKLPRDPIGRLFSTAGYAQHIVFAHELTASSTFAKIRAVHQAVEHKRGQSIPDWAHRDVLYMLIDYSERAHALLAGPLSGAERRELYDVFHRVGTGLGIPGLPPTYAEWRVDRERHLQQDLVQSEGTEALYARYRHQLGAWRYSLLLRVQAVLAPEYVRGLLHLEPAEWLRPLLPVYPLLVRAGLRATIQELLVPAEYLDAVRGLDHVTPRPRGQAPRTLHGPPQSAANGGAHGWSQNPPAAFTRPATGAAQGAGLTRIMPAAAPRMASTRSSRPSDAVGTPVAGATIDIALTHGLQARVPLPLTDAGARTESPAPCRLAHRARGCGCCCGS
jgi:hypothetical protein